MKPYHTTMLKAYAEADETLAGIKRAYAESVTAHPVLAVALLDIISAQAKITADLDALVAALGYEVKR